MPSIEPEATTLADLGGYLHVVVAVIENERDEVLIARRSELKHQGGLWEFPGGKVEAGEETFDALKRELSEELSVEPIIAHPLIRIPYSYPELNVLLDVWRVTAIQGEPHGAEAQEIEWVLKRELDRYEFPAANSPVISAAQLPSTYLITPEPGQQPEWPAFLQRLEQSLQAGIMLLQFRAIELDTEHYLMLAKEVVVRCHRHGAKMLLNADVSLLDKCNADGIHLNSHRLLASANRPVATDKILAASCHNIEELQHAQHIGAEFALLSPVKPTATHPEAEPLGWQQFHALSEQCSIPLYALGGMELSDLPQAWQHGAQGIAAIRSLWVETE